jgi:oligosaccharide reducing-end xylanase
MSSPFSFSFRWSIWLAMMLLPVGCTALSPIASNETPPEPASASNQYPNLFVELLGKSEAEVQTKLDEAWQHFFYGHDDLQRVYYPVSDDMAYILDVGHGDVRTEGMSYGMMIAVQMDKQEEFNRLWKWTKTYMYQEDGQYAGYFSWHNTPDGQVIDANPASDGEEWFVMALFFAANRWGNGEGIYNYQAEANKILRTMLHKSDDNTIATNMFHEDSHMVVFVPSRGEARTFTDPSYHLPYYYQLWAEWAAEDNDDWREAARVSREFLKTTVHPETGLMPDYANFDGSPKSFGGGPDHADFRFDAWRTIMNIAVDYAWFRTDEWQVEQSNRVLNFFEAQSLDSYVNQYTLDGEPLSSDRSPGLIAMNAVAALAANTDNRTEFVSELWGLSPPSGKWRYYDGMLYLLALLHVSGNFQIYGPAPN